jgi:hypothetical protein
MRATGRSESNGSRNDGPDLESAHQLARAVQGIAGEVEEDQPATAREEENGINLADREVVGPQSGRRWR